MMPSLLLKQGNYMSMLGGDNACMGCGEKTAIHLVLSAVNAMMAPRVEAHLAEISRLIEALDEKARTMLISEADLADVSVDAEGLEVTLESEKKETVARIHQANLVNFGVLPLLLQPEDYDRLDTGDVLRMTNLRDTLRQGGELTLRNETQGYDFAVRPELSPRQTEVLLAGGVLNYVREQLRERE